MAVNIYWQESRMYCRFVQHRRTLRDVLQILEDALEIREAGLHIHEARLHIHYFSDTSVWRLCGYDT